MVSRSLVFSHGRIFILEGIATVLLSGLILVFLPYDPRRCTFLTDNERDAILANLLAEGDGGHADFKWKYLEQTVKGERVLELSDKRLQSLDVHIFVVGDQHGHLWVGLAVEKLTKSFSYTLPTILVQLGYKAEIAQLMTVPM